MRAEQITQPCTMHGEGPVWDADASLLRWVDMLAGDVLTMTVDGDIVRHHAGDVAAALRPRVGGGLVVATECGFAAGRKRPGRGPGAGV